LQWTDASRAVCRNALAAFLSVVIIAALAGAAEGQPAPQPLSLLDVPFISQSEALCGGAAAAMLLRYWGERGIDAETFGHLVDRSAAGIRTNALIADLQGRGWHAAAVGGREETVRAELARGRPVLALIEDRPGTFHYLVIVAWHDRRVVFHDPARAPYRVMTATEFDRRWRPADRWMAVVLPAGEEGRLKPAPTTDAPTTDVGADAVVGAGFRRLDANTCDALVADGVRHAQGNDLAAAERILTSALSCPGAAAPRELAGVRLLQKRWPEVIELASSAVAADPRDAYAWKLLGTGRFLQNDRLGALRAWNETGEPRVDLVRIDGLRRTRQRAVETLLGIEAGDVLTPGLFLRARRRLGELPSAATTRLDYAPVPSGLAELRGAVSERAPYPNGRLAFAAMGLTAAASRELRVATASLTGGGERLSASWRFWERRPRVSVEATAPAPWGGIWGVELFADRQPFTVASLPRSERDGALLQVSDWRTGHLRLSGGAGIDRWAGRGTFARAAGGARIVSGGDRADVALQADRWLGDRPFGRLQASVRARSSTELRGTVAIVAVAVDVVSRDTPVGMWAAGDTGHARSTLMRAHPVLDDGRLRVDRLGRRLLNLSAETQHWRAAGSLLRVGAAAFADFGRTSALRSGPAFATADIGLGARFAVVGVPGIVRVDLAKGVTDGVTALSFVYQP
jgi:hypothetical protein